MEGTSMRRFVSIEPAVCGGRPHITGTRISVEIIHDHVFAGYTAQQIHAIYPHLSVKQIRAAIEYAQEPR